MNAQRSLLDQECSFAGEDARAPTSLACRVSMTCMQWGYPAIMEITVRIIVENTRLALKPNLVANEMSRAEFLIHSAHAFWQASNF